MKAIIINLLVKITIKNAAEDSGSETWEYISNSLDNIGSPFQIKKGFDEFEEFPTQENNVIFFISNPNEDAAEKIRTHLDGALKNTGWDYTVGIQSQSPVDGDGGFKAEFTDFKTDSNWVDGIVSNNDIKYKFQIKLFDESSNYGYKNGRCSKIAIWPSNGHFGNSIVHFDRNFWDVLPQPPQEVQALECAVALCEASPKRFE